MCAFGEKSEALRWSMETFTAKLTPAGQQDRDTSAPCSCFSPLHSQLFGSTSKERHGWRRRRLLEQGLKDPLFTSQREQGSLPRAFLSGRGVGGNEGGGGGMRTGGGGRGQTLVLFSLVYFLCARGMLVCLPACPRKWHELESSPPGLYHQTSDCVLPAEGSNSMKCKEGMSKDLSRVMS